MLHSRRKNLVITRAGSVSLHHSWLGESSARDIDRSFDLLVAAYDESALPQSGEQRDGVFHTLIPGYKVAGWAEIFKRHPELLERYDYIALVDEDIAANSSLFNNSFDLGKRYELELWQPSLTWDSYATYAATLYNPNYKIRFVNGVEMMCPFFKSSYLKKSLPLFSLGYETGIDLIWCSLDEQQQGKFAILDAVSVKHTQPVGGNKAANGFTGKSYDDDIHELLGTFSAEWPSFVAHKAIDRLGNLQIGKNTIGFRAFSLLNSLFEAPQTDRSYRLRSVLTHIRHQLTREPKYIENAAHVLSQLTVQPPARLSSSGT